MNNKCPYKISCKLEKRDDCYNKLYEIKQCYQQKAKNIISLFDRQEKKKKDIRKKSIEKIIKHAKSLDW